MDDKFIFVIDNSKRKTLQIIGTLEKVERGNEERKLTEVIITENFHFTSSGERHLPDPRNLRYYTK